MQMKKAIVFGLLCAAGPVESALSAEAEAVAFANAAEAAAGNLGDQLSEENNLLSQLSDAADKPIAQKQVDKSDDVVKSALNFATNDLITGVANDEAVPTMPMTVEMPVHAKRSTKAVVLASVGAKSHRAAAKKSAEDDDSSQNELEAKEQQLEKELSNLMTVQGKLEKQNVNLLEVQNHKPVEKKDASTPEAKTIKPTTQAAKKSKKHHRGAAELAQILKQVEVQLSQEGDDLPDSETLKQIKDEFVQKLKKKQTENARVEVAREKLQQNIGQLQEIGNLRGSYEDDKAFSEELTADTQAVEKEVHSKTLANVLMKIRKEMRLADKTEVFSALNAKEEQLKEEHSAWEKVVDMENERMQKMQHLQTEQGEGSFYQSRAEMESTSTYIAVFPQYCALGFVCAIVSAAINRFMAISPNQSPRV